MSIKHHPTIPAVTMNGSLLDFITWKIIISTDRYSIVFTARFLSGLAPKPGQTQGGWRDVHTIMTSRVTIINGAVTGGWARHGLIRHDSDTRQVEIVISDRIICYNSDNFPTRQTTCLLAGPQNAILHCTVPRSSFQHSPGQTFTWRHSGFTILKSKYYSVVYLQRDLMIFPEIM